MKKPSVYDVVVIGAGSGGLSSALTAAALGLKVMLVEKNAGHFGGECLHSGCVPSKALLHASNIKKSFTEARKHIEQVQASIYENDKPAALEAAGIEVKVGEAKLSGKSSISIDGKKIKARKIIIATGSKPKAIQLENHAKVPILTNENMFEMDNPIHILIVGAGSIGVEMASALINLGVGVTLLEKNKRILNVTRPFASQVLREQLANKGVDIYCNSELLQIDYGGRCHIATNSKDPVLTAPVSHVLLALGRAHDYSGLNLSAASVRTDESGQPIINSKLQSVTNRKIYFAGDAARKGLFSHAAEEHARVLFTNWLLPNSPYFVNKRPLPWTVFSNPSVSHFGHAYSNVKNKKNVRVLSGDFSRDDRALIDNYTFSKYELYVQRRFGRDYLLGGVVVAPASGELVQELMVVQEQKLPLKSIRDKLYVYPTSGRIWQQVFLNDYQNRMLSVRLKKILKLWFRILN